MKIRSLAHMSIFLLLIACSKSKDPSPTNQLTSCITVQSGTLTTLQNIQFTSCSHLAVSWLWDFGDGSAATTENPVHTYSQAGTFTVKLTTSDGKKTQLSSQQITVGKAAVFIHPTNTISHDSVWVTGVHIVTGTIKVNGAKLTIQPGATVRFTDGADKRIEVGSTGFGSSTFIANGTVTSPIQFTSNSLNAVNSTWGAINIGPNTTAASIISYTTIQHAGATYDNTRINAPLEFMDGGTIAVTNTTISNSSKYGIFLSPLSSFSTFTNNTIDLGTQHGFPISIDGDKLSSFVEASNTIKGSGILITKTGITTSVTFSPYSLPYYAENGLLIGNTTRTTVTFNPGCIFNMDGGGHIQSGGAGYSVKFVVAGTASNPVIFQPANDLYSWPGIRWTAEFGTDSYMDYAQIKSAYNVSSGEGVIHVDGGAKLNLTNSYLNGDGCLVWMTKTALLGNFTGNTFDRVYRQYYSSILITEKQFNNFPTGNTFKNLATDPWEGIYVEAYNINSYTFNISTDFNITNPGAPYFIQNWINVGNSASPNAGPTLTIQPGVELRFSAANGFQVGKDEHFSSTAGLDAKLIMNGTPTAPIKLTYFDDGINIPTWEGLYLYQGTNPATSINYVTIDGADTYDLYIEMNNGASVTPYPVIQNSTFSNASMYPIFVYTNSKPDIKNTNTYTGNGTNSVYYY